MATAPIYHRIATGKENQDFHTVLAQVSNNEIWGGVSMYGNLFPTVRAKPGELPDNKDGIEFSTTIPPTPNSSTPVEVYWKLDASSPGVESSADGQFARIKVTIRKVRYTKETNLKPRCEWPKT